MEAIQREMDLMSQKVRECLPNNKRIGVPNHRRTFNIKTEHSIEELQVDDFPR